MSFVSLHQQSACYEVGLPILFALWAAVSQIWAVLKIAIYGHENWLLAKVPEVAHMLPFYPSGSNLSIFSLNGQAFLRYGPFFKIAIVGHETWPLAKVPEVSYILPFYLKGSTGTYFRSTDSGFRDTCRFSKLQYLSMKLGLWPKFQKLLIRSFYLQGSKLSSFSLYGQRFRRNRPIFKIAIFGHGIWNLI